ncbi:SDR family NAD(P)-dependent oxidoreductase [Paralimibaculum aggregatum]|uniref:SDR family NAD(P)-dependent oxidoreductase n=1 Tax=Paralimibaculum aggregatum TaxID=3036245 RepID=A0ABQ6LNN7_9RHOB|nr:SDR family NAD(P)-dependent oxidoreductase [Limibaculum sp. NKW23]GMG84612.1 SDR family NAD(P)-dependent oxidoreductase [Limibaculum sp. NKW23]
MNRIDLEGKRAIVTGGAQGIGRAVVERMIASGAQVTIWDVDRALGQAAAEELGAGYVDVDLTDWAAVRSAHARTAAEMGGIEILVNNAGIAGLNAPVAEYPVEEWRRVLAIDLDAVFHCCKAVVPGMVEGGYGRIVNVASIAGKEGNPNASAYSAAKAGVIALTKSLGKELAGQDISVNCVTPAAARTAIFDQMTEEHIGYMLSKIPRGRFVTVDEVAGMICWLASAETSFTTGGVFDISGGRATY